jgi:probable HAF family extracellular repeat protein
VGFYSDASAINNNGQIVGLSYDANSVGKATLWDGTNPPIDLNDYLDQASRDAGWIITHAMDINDSG